MLWRCNVRPSPFLELCGFLPLFVPPFVLAASLQAVLGRGGGLGFLLKDVSSDINVEGPASVLFSGSGRVLDNKGAAISSHQVYRISRSSAEKALCVFVTPGGGVKLCNPALASGEPFACQPQISLVKCPKA